MKQLTTGKFIAKIKKRKNLTPELEKQKNLSHGFLLIVIGNALQVLSHTFGGSNVKDFLSGLLLGVSIAEMLLLGVSIAEILAGVYVLGRNIVKR